MFIILPVILLFIGVPTTESYALQTPIPLSSDSRLKTVRYNQNDIVEIHAGQLMITSIQFAENEVINGYYYGDEPSWSILASKSRPNLLLIKPTTDHSTTNLTVTTNQHIYHFQLSATGGDDISYNIHFVYPDTVQQVKQQMWDSIDQAIRHNKNIKNKHYSYHGDPIFAPVSVFDDDQFTYLQFSKYQKIPAIFSVDFEGNESLLNVESRDDYQIIKQVFKQLSLRIGNKTISIFNDRLIGE